MTDACFLDYTMLQRWPISSACDIPAIIAKAAAIVARDSDGAGEMVQQPTSFQPVRSLVLAKAERAKGSASYVLEFWS